MEFCEEDVIIAFGLYLLSEEENCETQKYWICNMF